MAFTRQKCLLFVFVFNVHLLMPEFDRSAVAQSS